MNAEGPQLHTNAIPKAVVKNADGSLTLELEDGRSQTVDCLIWAIGREPATDNFNLAATGVKTNDKGYIIVDKFQNTNVPGIYAVGDNTGAVELTPVAVAAGRRLSERLFNNKPEEHLDYSKHPDRGLQPSANRHRRLNRAAGARAVRRRRREGLQIFLHRDVYRRDLSPSAVPHEAGVRRPGREDCRHPRHRLRDG